MSLHCLMLTWLNWDINSRLLSPVTVVCYFPVQRGWCADVGTNWIRCVRLCPGRVRRNLVVGFSSKEQILTHEIQFFGAPGSCENISCDSLAGPWKAFTCSSQVSTRCAAMNRRSLDALWITLCYNSPRISSWQAGIYLYCEVHTSILRC